MTTSSHTTTASTPTTTISGQGAQPGYPESWAQAVVNAANQDDFGLLDTYVFASDEKREVYRAFVESDLPRLSVSGPCESIMGAVQCPISFDDEATYSVHFAADEKVENFADLTVLPDHWETMAPDGAYGSGCSPGPGALPDGMWFGHIVTRSSFSFEFDLACQIPHEMVDSEIVDSSSAIRSIAVDDDVHVTEILPPEPTFAGTTYENWGAEWCETAGSCDVWIGISDGRLIYIYMQFFA